MTRRHTGATRDPLAVILPFPAPWSDAEAGDLPEGEVPSEEFVEGLRSLWADLAGVDPRPRHLRAAASQPARGRVRGAEVVSLEDWRQRRPGTSARAARRRGTPAAGAPAPWPADGDGTLDPCG
jgi:hypothetical protein